MRYLRRVRRMLVAGCAVVASLTLLAPVAAAPGLATGLWHPGTELGVQRVRAAGATVVYMILDWSAVAPPDRGPQFRPEDPSDPAYRWASVDERLSAALRQGLTP